MKSQPKKQIQTRLAVPPILTLTPALMESVIHGFQPNVLDWQPNPERWSVNMVIAHLAESEVAAFACVCEE